MIYIQWMKQRIKYLRRILISLFYTTIYQKQSRFLLHKTNAHSCPYQFIMFYNAFGRMLFAFKEFLALITKEKIFKKSITIDGFDATIDYAKLYSKGDNNRLWPKSPMVEISETVIDDKYYKKIANSFLLAHQHDSQEKDITQEWNRISKEFREIFFDENHEIIKDNLKNFQSDPLIYNKIFNNQYQRIDKNNSYIDTYLTAIDLVNEYHRYGEKIDKELLASSSESTAGNYLCINYQGKRLSEQFLQHIVIANDIIKHVPFSSEKRNTIVDIGAGFGGSTRILSYYTPNTSYILLDLPETLFLTAYYLKYNFPHKKIALLEDVYPHLDNFDKIIEEYDFIIVPPFVLDYVTSKSVDLVINATSLAFISEEYLTHYLKETKRVLKDYGYFYSLNTTEDSKWGIGSHNWDYRADYLTRMYNFDNRFSYPQWLGQKVTEM